VNCTIPDLSSVGNPLALPGSYPWYPRGMERCADEELVVWISSRARCARPQTVRSCALVPRIASYEWVASTLTYTDAGPSSQSRLAVASSINASLVRIQNEHRSLSFEGREAFKEIRPHARPATGEHDVGARGDPGWRSQRFCRSLNYSQTPRRFRNRSLGPH